VFVIIAIALPHILPIFLAIFIFFYRISYKFSKTSREVKRFDGVTRSPVFAMLSSNIRGTSTIRAFSSAGMFQDKFLDALELNSTWWLAFLLSSRWYGFRMDGITAAIMFCSVLLSICLADEVSVYRICHGKTVAF